MSIINGQAANAAITNAAFASKTANNTLIGVQNLDNTTDPNSGDEIVNLQRAINELFDADGTAGEGDSARKNYSSTVYIANGDDRKVAIGKLDAALDTVAGDVAQRIPTIGSSTDNAIARWNGSGGDTVQDSGVTIDDSDNVDIPGDLVVGGDLTVTGTTTALGGSTTVDPTIEVNTGGDDMTAEDGGLLVDRTGTKGAILYEDALASKWKCGPLGSESEIVDVDSTQTLEGKTIDGDDNTFANIRNAGIASDAAIARSKIAPGSPDYVVFNDGSTGELAEEQYLSKSRGGSGQDNSGLTFPSTGEVLARVGPVGQFALTNNSSGQVVTGLIFDKTVYRKVEVKWTAYRKHTGGLGIRVAAGSFIMIHDDTNWTLTELGGAGNAGVSIDFVAGTGQVKVDTDDGGGTPVAETFDFETIHSFEV